MIVIIFSLGCQLHSQSQYIKPIEKNFENPMLNKLKQRNLEYWNLFAQKKFTKTYQFEMPHQRFLHSLKWYKEFNTKYNDTNATFEQLNIQLIDKNKAVVKMRKILPSSSHIFDDKWYYVDGVWYHQMKTTILPLPFEMD